MDLAGPSEMRREALKALHDMAADEMAEGLQKETLTVSVRDEAGARIYSATLSVRQLGEAFRAP